MVRKLFSLSIFLFAIITSVYSQEKSWMIGPFTKTDSANPVLGPKATEFLDPIYNKKIKWENKDVFNPAAIVKSGSVYLLYRAEDTIGKFAGTSRIGIGKSDDGIHFKTDKNPVVYPQKDAFMKVEWEGGCEDPRIIEDDKGNYFIYYTGYDGTKARLLVAESKDLYKWKKHGSVFTNSTGGDFTNYWSKSGSVVCELKGDKMIAKKINGKYWMYWGESNIYAATSTDLIHWQPVLETDPQKQMKDTMRGYDETFKTVFGPRPGKFDSHLVEPGPPAIYTENGIIFLYNSRNHPDYGDSTLRPGTYAAGQILLDKNDPLKVLDRCNNYFFAPDKPYEINGQVNHVTFIEGLVRFKNKWYLYYGTADSKIAVATAPLK